MMWPGYPLAFYGIFLGHEHRTLIGEGNVRGPQARVVRKRMFRKRTFRGRTLRKKTSSKWQR